MNRLKAVSLFANVGIAEAYFDEIGIDVVLANELDEQRSKFYREVYPNVEMIQGDITDPVIRSEIILKAMASQVDLLLATPPCQGMSVAGSRNEFDERNQLIYYAIDVIKNVMPKFVFLENVPRQLQTKVVIDEEVLYIPQYIERELSPYYNFNENTLIRAKDHGVPQLRERNIYILVRKDVQIDWTFPEKEDEITLESAIGHLPTLDPYLREGLDITLEKFPEFEQKKQEGLQISKWHYPPTHSWKQVEWMKYTPTGKSAIYNEEFFPKKDDGTPIKAHHNHYRRLKWDMPCRTITQNSGVISSLACVHPGRMIGVDNQRREIYSDARVLTIYELLIVSSLPLDWNIPDWASDTLIRKVIGEGIPSLLVKKIMLELLNQL